MKLSSLFPFPKGKGVRGIGRHAPDETFRFPFPLGKRLLPTIWFPFPLGKGLGVRLLAIVRHARAIPHPVLLSRRERG